MSVVYAKRWERRTETRDDGVRLLMGGPVAVLRLWPIKLIHEHAPREFTSFSRRNFRDIEVAITYRKGCRFTVRWVGWSRVG